jgi:ADP-L-glycero-D-manno-heptose 6-epimerase
MTDLSSGRILVTGGAGFIGSALIWELNRRGFTNILACDLLRHDEKWKNLVPLRFADYIEGDELEKRIRESPAKLKDVRSLFHLGACSATTETNASYLIRNNFEYTKLLAHFALEGSCRFVYASSAATYGGLETIVSESLPLETLRPLNMYGYSKHLFDCYAEQAGFLNQITGLKYFNVYGPNEDHKGNMRSVVNKAFHEIQQSGRMSLFKSYKAEYPDGGQKRDFLYVKDAVAVTVDLAEKTGGGGLFNIGSGEPNTWLALAHAIFRPLGLEPAIDFVEMPEKLRAKYQYFTCANLCKLRSAGHTAAFTPLEKAVGDYLHNYLLPNRKLGDE